MIYATARITVPEAKLDEALEILASVAEVTRFEAGCVSCKLYRDAGSENTIMIEEVWNDKEDLERHLRSDEYQKILLVAEMAIEPPQIGFYTVRRSGGVEIIEQARAAAREGKE